MDRTSEELAERQRVHDLMGKAMDQDIWKMADLMLGKRDDQLFGETEFTLRDIVLRSTWQAKDAAVPSDRVDRAPCPITQTDSPHGGNFP